jgi:hypothetical protein
VGEPGRDEDRRRAVDDVELVAEHDLAHELLGGQDEKQLGEGVLLGGAARVARFDPVDGDRPLRLGMGHHPARRSGGSVLESREPPGHDEIGVAPVGGGSGRRREREAPRRGLGEAPYSR